NDWREHIWQKQVTRVFSLKSATDQLREIEFAPRLVGDDLLLVLRDVTNSHQAEEALRAMELKFSAVFQPVETGIALVDRTGRFLDTNPAFEELLGIPHHELRRMSLADCVAFSDIERIRAAEVSLESPATKSESEDDEPQEDQAVFSGEKAIHFRPREGDTIPAEVRLSVVCGPLGQRLYSILHVRSDAATGRGFEQSRAQHRAMLEAIPDLILVLDREGTVTELMPANGGDWRGVVADASWEGRAISEIWPAFAEAAGDRISEAIDEARIRSWRFTETSDDSREVHYSVRVAPCEGDGAVAVVMDVTEEAEARESLVRQGLAFRHLDEAILVTNLRGRITDFNAAAEQIFGYRLSEIAGEGLAKLYAEPGQEKALNSEISTALNGSGRWQTRRTFFRKDGTSGEADIVFLPVEESGSPRSLLGIHREVTERSPDTDAAEKMQHRWRNQLQEINGLMSLELPTLDAAESAALTKMQARLKVISRLHELAESIEAPVDLVPFARALAADLRRISGPEADQRAPLLEVRAVTHGDATEPAKVMTDFETATTFGLLFAEIALGLFRLENEGPASNGVLTLGQFEGHPIVNADLPYEIMPTLSLPVLKLLVEQLRGSLKVRNEAGRAKWILRFPAKR
ncbi:MAG: PAS domain S-box protein, partial [Verrucomicrobiae bacterium]|nr:PAS domain S-box protein [Verrucomicrobiae bacterium]